MNSVAKTGSSEIVNNTSESETCENEIFNERNNKV